MPTPSIDDQIARMRDLWPTFRVRAQTSFAVVWQGELSTAFKSYAVKIQLIRLTLLDGDMWLDPGSINPQVWITSPELRLRPGERRLPHTYACAWRPPLQESLCLHYPNDESWSDEDFVADKIVSWAAEWLLFYEGWLVTGEFHGPGLHPSDEEHQQWQTRRRSEAKSRPLGDLPARFNPSAESFVGRRSGTFASFPLMEAASRGFTRPRFLHAWKTPWVAAASPATSTSSLGLQPGGSSPSGWPQA